MNINDSKYYILKVLTGPHKGASYKIISDNITIGRSTYCDITFDKDKKVSRKHIRISFKENQAIIENLSDRNVIFIDGKVCKGKAFFSYTSSFQLGDTECQIRVLDAALVHAIKKDSPPSPQSKNQMPIEGKQDYDSLSSFKENPPKKKIKIYIIGVLLLGVLLFFMQEDKKKGDPFKVSTESQVSEQIEANRKIASTLDKEVEDKKKNTLQYKEAYVHYVKGLRDYNKGFYRRAMVSFQACFSLLQGHVMCRRYYNLTSKKLSELIQYYMVQGKKYMSRYQFPACQTAYRNVMSMIQDRKNKIYKEANSYFLLCKKRWNNRF